MMDTDLLGDVFQCHAVKAVRRKQKFGSIKDLLHHLGALLRLRRFFYRSFCF